jgi:hypothetical protein
MDAITMTEETNALLDLLAEARIDAANAREQKRVIIEKAQSLLEYKRADNETNKADARIAELETEIRARALAMYDEDCELPSRVAVKMFTVVTVPDENKAKEWCLRNFTPCLKLDIKSFEKAAKDGGIPGELATVEKEPRAQIATKL